MNNSNSKIEMSHTKTINQDYKTVDNEFIERKFEVYNK